MTESGVQHSLRKLAPEIYGRPVRVGTSEVTGPPGATKERPGGVTSTVNLQVACASLPARSCR